MKPLLIALLLIAPFAAFSHEGTDIAPYIGFSDGFFNSIKLLFYIISFTAMGAICAVRGRESLIILPAAYLAILITGVILGFFNFEIPFRTVLIPASIGFLGISLIKETKLNDVIILISLSILAVFNGFEITEFYDHITLPLQYFTGSFLSATLIFCLSFAFFYFLTRKSQRKLATKFFGSFLFLIAIAFAVIAAFFQPPAP